MGASELHDGGKPALKLDTGASCNPERRALLMMMDEISERDCRAEVPPEGADGGIDVVAGSGPLGLDSPRISGQVKSGTSRVDAPTVQQLQGAITTHGADHGLLVAWGGLTTQAQQAVRSQRFRLRVWDADDLIEAICRTYDRLPDEMQARLPLKPVWVVVEND